MRVIAGTYRSRRLVTPRGTATRPTSDRLRETLFNILSPRIAGAFFLDLYAGAGAVGIEAASRGAAAVYFAETGRAALTALRSNLSTLGIAAEVESGGTAVLLRRLVAAGEQANIVFLDPPYEAAEEYDQTLSWLGTEGIALLAHDAIVVVEHRSKLPLSGSVGTLNAYRTVRQGDTTLTFYQVGTI